MHYEHLIEFILKLDKQKVQCLPPITINKFSVLLTDQVDRTIQLLWRLTLTKVLVGDDVEIHPFIGILSIRQGSVPSPGRSVSSFRHRFPVGSPHPWS